MWFKSCRPKILITSIPGSRGEIDFRKILSFAGMLRLRAWSRASALQPEHLLLEPYENLHFRAQVFSRRAGGGTRWRLFPSIFSGHLLPQGYVGRQSPQSIRCSPVECGQRGRIGVELILQRLNLWRVQASRCLCRHEYRGPFGKKYFHPEFVQRNFTASGATRCK